MMFKEVLFNDFESMLLQNLNLLSGTYYENWEQKLFCHTVSIHWGPFFFSFKFSEAFGGDEKCTNFGCRPFFLKAWFGSRLV